MESSDPDWCCVASEAELKIFSDIMMEAGSIQAVLAALAGRE